MALVSLIFENKDDLADNSLLTISHPPDKEIRIKGLHM